jgi:hypothetical protein
VTRKSKTLKHMVSERTYTVKLRGRDVKIGSRALAVFRDMYVSTSELASRMSELIWLDIYILDAAFSVSPHDILRAIGDLERGEQRSGIKPATQFQKMPLKGLWLQHYFSARFLPKNIHLELGKTGVEKLVKKVMDPAKSTKISPEMIKELAHRVIHEPLETRSARKKLTGEWIIYLRHEGENYYLCCNTHSAGDRFIYDRIMENCVRDFPNLPAWLKAERISSARR